VSGISVVSVVSEVSVVSVSSSHPSGYSKAPILGFLFLIHPSKSFSTDFCVPH